MKKSIREWNLKSIKNLLCIFTLIVMLFTMLPMSASALVVGDWIIEISDGEAYISGYNGVCPDKFTLPNTIGNFKVAGLKKNIFSDNVKEIIVPDGYKSIVISDSYGENLSNIKNTLEKISLPSTLTKFSVNFIGFTKLTEITIPGSVKEICDSQFKDCVNLENIYLNNGLEKIGTRAFWGCVKLNDIKIPETVVHIGGEAFRDCDSLKNMVIPNSVRTFGCSDEKRRRGSAVFFMCDNLETVVLSDNIKYLGSSSIGGHGELALCPKLKSVYIGNSIDEFQSSPGAYTGVLGGSEELKILILPEGLKSIGSGNLKNSINLEAIVLPKSFSQTQYNLTENSPFYLDNDRDAVQPLPKLFIYGYKGSYAETFSNNNGFPFVDISVASPTSSKVLINGNEVAFTAYNIGGNNYFKLRDIASAINGTDKNFSVSWDGENNAISLGRKKTYINVGGELVINSNACAVEPKISNPKIFVDGKLTTFMAFNIDGNNYIKLRDLGEVFDFGVDWNESTQTIEVNTNKSYAR